MCSKSIARCARANALIIGYVLINADALAKIGGAVWLVIGAIVFATNVFRGRGVPELAEEPAAEPAR